MENPGSEIQDWDWEVVVHDKSDDDHQSSGGGGVICSDYFSLESEHNYAAASANDAAAVEEGEGGESDNPSWVDPSGSSVVGGNSGRRKRSRTSSPSSDSDSSGRNLMYLLEPHSDCCGGGFECRNEEEENSVNGLASDRSDNGDEEQKQEGIGENDEVSEAGFEQEGEMNRVIGSDDGDEKKSVVWWKVPLEVLRYCVLRVSPVWSLSMATAALMGFVLLRRRYLYKMKRKSLGIQLNVTVDDKKISQFMSRAARLNEAFSVVKRVPIIRPALPAPGIAPWPVMSLR